MMKKIMVLLLASVVLLGCQANNNTELVRKITELELKVEKLSAVQTEIAQKTGLGALVRPAELIYADGHKIGNSKAKVAILEFTDLHCPFCAKFNKEVWPELKKQYVDKGQVLFVGREFPLYQSHPQAPFAALTLRCAAVQNIYSPMKDYLFTTQNSLKQVDVDTELAKLKADPKKHAECLKNAEFQTGIRDSTLYGGQLGLSSTPTFFIGINNGTGVIEYKEVIGAKSYAEFAQILDEMLAK
jgi:protein-disulfide isomerase